MIYLYYSLLAIVSYFIGNINFARIMARSKNDDITKYGSGNPGTLNTWRAFGFWPGVITFTLDMLKGVVPTLIAYLTFGNLGCNPEIAKYVAAFAVVLGHIFPVVFNGTEKCSPNAEFMENISHAIFFEIFKYIKDTMVEQHKICYESSIQLGLLSIKNGMSYKSFHYEMHEECGSSGTK